jgi:hypothetical protein
LIDGKKIGMDTLSPTALSRMIAEGVAAEVKRTVRCDVHRGAPEIAIFHAEPEGLEYAITGCCDGVRKKARAAIDDLLGSGIAAA